MRNLIISGMAMAAFTTFADMAGSVGSTAEELQRQLTLAPAAACDLIADGREVRTLTGTIAQLDCAEATHLLSCSGKDVEPLDVTVGDACRAAVLPLRAAVAVTVASDKPQALTVDWVDISNPQARVAHRSVQIDGVLTINVADLPGRYVRFSRPGASPVTVPASELLRSDRWLLPDPRPGGEVLIRVVMAPISPRGFRLGGGRGEEFRQFSDDGFAIQGVFPGSYSVVPLYDGQVEGLARNIVVNPAESTVVTFLPEMIGGAAITADRDLCGAASEFTLIAIRSDQKETRQTVFHTRDLTDCRWGLGGLRPGTYVASLLSQDGSGGSEVFEVYSQQRSPVTLSKPAVQVTGTITYNSKPTSLQSVTFALEGGLSPVTVKTDAVGWYSVTLDRPGEYVVAVRSDTTAWQQKTVTLEPGANVLDWKLSGGSITLRVRGHALGERVVVNLVQPSTGSMWMKAFADASDEMRWEALPLGDYDVRARQTGVTSGVIRVSLNRLEPDASVDLDLKQNQSALILRDDAGNPVSGARVRTFPSASPPETEPGTYSLRAVPAGSQLRIVASGFVPVCKQVLANENVHVTMSRGVAVVLELPPSDGQPFDLASRSIGGIQGSDCPIPLNAFEIAAAAASTASRPRMLVSNFPSGERFLLLTPRGQETVVVEGSRILVK